MSKRKAKMIEVIQSQPEDATYEEIMRELTFEITIDRGLADSRNGRAVADEDIEHWIHTWHISSALAS